VRGTSSGAPEGERETKFVFDASRALQVLGLLRARCRPDAAHPAGLVSSVYFDSPDWFHLDEKRNSDHEKTKVRVRWYADLVTGEPRGMAFLEVKGKLGAVRRKLRVPTDVPAEHLAALPLESREMRELPRRLLAANVGVSQALVPAFQITYERRRFVEPSTRARLCVDTAIRVPRTNRARLPRAHPKALDVGVFEMKSALDDLPSTLTALRDLGCRKQSFSKYMGCFDWITDTIL
jgi:hypothetical protein